MSSIRLRQPGKAVAYLRRERRAGKKLIAFAIGTRPEAIKTAPVIRELQRRHDRFVVGILITGQHPDVAALLRDDFGLDDTGSLEVMRRGQSLNQLAGRIFFSIDELWTIGRANAVHADLWMVQGDTTSAVGVGMAAVYNGRPLAHIEAGLRTDDRWDPFPEEINRRLLAPLASMHFAPTEIARQALLREGVAARDIAVVGNTGIDALLQTLATPFVAAGTPLEGIPLDQGRLLVATVHRRESWPALGDIARALLALAARFDDLRIVMPVHPNPDVANTLRAALVHPRIHLTAPLAYRPFVHLLQRSTLILTDSGGIQEEAPSLRKPALVLRDRTERAEALGQIKVIGRSADRIEAEATRLLNDPDAYAAMQHGVNPFGDGLAAERIVDAVDRWFEGATPLLPREREFRPDAIHRLDVA